MNNRILKFRIWDKQKLNWASDNILLLNTKGELGFNTSNGWYKIPDTGQKDLGVNRFVIQQFTGLLDQNGKDIYEGDIVKWSHGVEDIGEVKYYTNDNIGPAMTYFGLNVERLWACQFQSDDEYEVIGNIFEK